MYSFVCKNFSICCSTSVLGFGTGNFANDCIFNIISPAPVVSLLLYIKYFATLQCNIPNK